MSADIDGISTMIIFDDCWMWLDDVGQQAGREFAIFFQSEAGSDINMQLRKPLHSLVLSEGPYLGLHGIPSTGLLCTGMVP